MNYLQISTSDIFMKLVSKHIWENNLYYVILVFLHGLKMKVQEVEDG